MNNVKKEAIETGIIKTPLLDLLNIKTMFATLTSVTLDSRHAAAPSNNLVRLLFTASLI